MKPVRHPCRRKRNVVQIRECICGEKINKTNLMCNGVINGIEYSNASTRTLHFFFLSTVLSLRLMKSLVLFLKKKKMFSTAQQIVLQFLPKSCGNWWLVLNHQKKVPKLSHYAKLILKDIVHARFFKTILINWIILQTRQCVKIWS